MIVWQNYLSAINGILSKVLPFSNLPAFFLFTPPHCLKKNGTFEV
jgi:hypothetical protein